MIQKTYKPTALLIIIFVVMLLLSPAVSAYVWPGTKWTNGGEPISIKLTQDPPAHTDETMAFGVYFSGNTTNNNGTFTIELEGLNCNPNNLEYTVYRIRADNTIGNTTNKKCNDRDSNGNLVGNIISVSYRNGLGTFLPNTGDSNGRTQYRIAISAFAMNDRDFMKFKVKVANASYIGFLRSDYRSILGWFTSVPIVMDSSNNNIFRNVNIPLAKSCGSPDGREIIDFYDLDNYGGNNPNGAQDNGGWLWNGTNGGDGQPNGFNYNPLEVYMRLDGTATNKPVPYKSNDSYNQLRPVVGWQNVNNTKVFRPNSFGADNIYNGVNGGTPPPKLKKSSNETGQLHYQMLGGRTYTLTLKDLNAQNYISLQSTVDEKEGCVNPNPVLWSISLSPDQNRTVFQGATVGFSHQVRNNGPSSLDRFVDVDVFGYGGNSEWWFYDMDDGTNSGATNTTGVNGIPARQRQMNALGNYCDTIRANPISSSTGGSAETNDCVHVIDPEAIVPNRVEFEKGSGSVTVAGTNINVNNGGSCPVTPISIPYTWSIGGVSGSSSFTYGGTGSGACNNRSNLIPISPGITNQLNNQAPGPSGIQYCLNVNNEGNRCGEIVVYEVPFARFYGNDVYSTNGQIKFNDSNNANAPGTYEERGSVAQYAAFASGANNFLDTAAFRYRSTYNPQPPTGLMAASSYLTQNSGNVYDNVSKNLPDNCLTTINPAAIPQSGSGVCYDLGSSNVTLTGLNYSNKITIKTTGNIYISGNLINATSSANKQNPSNTGVLLLAANNVYIDRSVTRVDAIIVANNNITTCSNGISTVINNQLHNLCRSKLVVNGSLSANSISFSRVGGSRYLAPAGAGANNDLGAGIEEKNGEASLALNSGLSAEIVNFPAYLYWAKPYLQDNSKSGGTVDSMFVAPPRK